MSLKFYLFLIPMFIVLYSNAQRQSYSTINGNCFQFFEAGCDSPYANMILKFNDDSLDQIIEPLNLNLATNYSRAAFSDTNGNLLFASNGWRLVNSQGEVLSYKLWRDEMPHPNDSPDTTMTLNTLGPLFLNDPGDSSKAYLFYGEYQIFNDAPYTINADTYFSYAYLDNENQSLISQNNTVLDVPTNYGNMQACRHGNGRDWWIIKSGIRENKFFIGLLDPSGIEMEEITISGIPNRTQGNTFSQFSFDGTRFVHYTCFPNRIIYTYDFDRCSGHLSNMQMHDLSDSLRAGDLNAFALSPDGDIAYIKKGGYISEPQQVQGLLQYQFSTGQYYYATEFASAPFLEPNGKRMLIQTATNIGQPNINFYLSEITEPNLFGSSCNIQLHKYSIQNNATFIMPSNYANFKLGALSGSICDSLNTGIQLNTSNSNIRFKIFPNPVESSLTIEQDIPINYEVIISDMLGRTQWKGQIHNQKTILSNEITDLSQGIYWIEIQDLKTGNRSGKKFIKQD